MLFLTRFTGGNYFEGRATPRRRAASSPRDFQRHQIGECSLPPPVLSSLRGYCKSSTTAQSMRHLRHSNSGPPHCCYALRAGIYLGASETLLSGAGSSCAATGRPGD